MNEKRKLTHLIHVRACDADPAGGSVVTNVGYDTDPPPTAIRELEVATVEKYRQIFDEPPDRAIAVVLPWIDSVDEHIRGDEDD